MSPITESRLFSSGVELALRAALEAHHGQVRKSAETVPYITHPVHVALMLSRLDMDDEVVQAALLHDVVEDCESWSLERIRQGFGERVARLVGELTEDKSLPWEERKRRAVDHAPRLSPEAAAIKACDKLHNLESLLSDLRDARDRETVWSRFNGGRTDTLAMSRRLVSVLAPRVCPPPRERLARRHARARGRARLSPRGEPLEAPPGTAARPSGGPTGVRREARPPSRSCPPGRNRSGDCPGTANLGDSRGKAVLSCDPSVRDEGSSR